MPYNGSIDLISGVRPKNGGDFPLVDAGDVRVDDSHRLSDKMAHLDKIATCFGISASGGTATASRALRPLQHVTGTLLTLEENKPVAQDGKWVSNSAQHQYAIFIVTPGVRYYITGDVPSNSIYHVAAFFDAAGGYLSRVPREESLAYVDYPVVAPENADHLTVICPAEAVALVSTG